MPVIKLASTLAGVAETDFVLERAEPLAISVRSANAHTSKIIRLNPGEPPVTEIPPTPTPTETPTPTPTETPTPTLTPTATPVPIEPSARVGGNDLAMVALAIMVIGGVGFVVGRGDGGSTVAGMRLFLWSWVLGMVGYSLYGIGALEAMEQVEPWGALLVGIAGGLLPVIAYAALGLVRRRREKGPS